MVKMASCFLFGRSDQATGPVFAEEGEVGDASSWLMNEVWRAMLEGRGSKDGRWAFSKLPSLVSPPVPCSSSRRDTISSSFGLGNAAIGASRFVLSWRKDVGRIQRRGPGSAFGSGTQESLALFGGAAFDCVAEQRVLLIELLYKYYLEDFIYE